jgi:hypothetical protein
LFCSSLAEASNFMNEEQLTQLAQRAAGKLNELIEKGHDTTAFSIAIGLALLKDAIDIGADMMFFGLIPVLGQLPGMFISATLFFFMFGKGYFLQTRVKIIWWVCGIFLDNLPGLNAVPITTLTVIYAWHLTRKKGQEAEEKLSKLKEFTNQQLQELAEEE